MIASMVLSFTAKSCGICDILQLALNQARPLTAHSLPPLPEHLLALTPIQTPCHSLLCQQGSQPTPKHPRETAQRRRRRAFTQQYSVPLRQKCCKYILCSEGFRKSCDHSISLNGLAVTDSLLSSKSSEKFLLGIIISIDSPPLTQVQIWLGVPAS
jgi:hypothetical protein